MSRQYVDIVAQLRKTIDVPAENLTISKMALAGAFGEAAMDVQIMFVRRKCRKGVSASKIAGAILFRLCRFAPVHLAGGAEENTTALEINALAALALVCKAVLHVSPGTFPDPFTKELLYTLSRRHMNQETLGLALDMLQSSAVAHKS